MLIRIFSLLLLLSGCTNFDIHRIDIQQGNLVTQDQLAKIKPGMSRGDVRGLLGTPLLQDVYHANRWDYFFSMAPGGKVTEKHHITIFFENDKVSKVEGQGAEREVSSSGGEKRTQPSEFAAQPAPKS